MNALKNKIKSQRGASITFALLLFLVCAVISGVVIVAATAAAGRMSNQDEMDERYYAVTAAASRLNDIFNGREVIINYSLKDVGKPDYDDVTVKDSNGELFTNTTLLYRTSKDVLQGVVYGDMESINEPDQISITDTVSESSVTCTVDRKLNYDGRTEYTVSAQKTVNASNKGKYTVYISFSPNVLSKTEDLINKNGRAVIKWKLLGVKKNRAEAAKTQSGSEDG